MKKWFRDKEKLKKQLKENEKDLENVTIDKMELLLKDQNNLIKDHLELLEAIKILKDKLGLEVSKYGKQYCIFVFYKKNLTEKQYKLLKEVLKNDS